MGAWRMHVIFFTSPYVFSHPSHLIPPSPSLSLVQPAQEPQPPTKARKPSSQGPQPQPPSRQAGQPCKAGQPSPQEPQPPACQEGQPAPQEGQPPSQGPQPLTLPRGPPLAQPLLEPRQPSREEVVAR